MDLPKLNQRGDIIDAFIVSIVGAIMAIPLVFIMPVLIDNLITPQIVNRQFGSVSIQLYELIILIYTIVFIIMIFQTLRTPSRQGTF